MTKTVRDLMTEEVISTTRRESLAVVYEIMLDGGFRHMPVLDGEDLIGIISQRDIAAALGSASRDDRLTQSIHLEETTVEQVMTGIVDTADPDDEIATAAQILLENKISCLPVVEGSHLVGILTEADFVRYVASLG